MIVSRLRPLLAAAALASAGAPAPAAAQSFRITDLGRRGVASFGRGLGGDGSVVGKSGARAFVRPSSGEPMKEIAPPRGFVAVEAEAVGEAGQLVGALVGADHRTRHALHFDGVEAHDLGPGVARAINADGVIAGEASGRPVLWEEGEPTMLAGLDGGGGRGGAFAVNGDGAAAGFAYLDARHHHAVRWDADGTAHDLGTLGGGRELGCDLSSAHAINADGEVVGHACTAEGVYHAFLAAPGDGTLTDLGTLGGPSFALGINAAGEVVGASGAGRESRAFLWDAVDGMRDLRSLLVGGEGWSALLYAAAINDDGQITGAGVVDGEVHAFLLTPQ